MVRATRSSGPSSWGRMIKTTIIIIVPYLLGGVPFGFLIGKLFGRSDIRQEGSGNIGAANVLRTTGKAAGVCTLLLDVMKGVLSVLLASSLTGRDPSLCGIAALSAIVGHIFPIYLRFKGGKGFAVTIGSFLVLTPAAMVCSLFVFFAAAVPTRIISVGSIAASLALPVFTLIFRESRIFFFFAVAAALLIIMRHASNIGNLIRGVEPRIGERSR